MVSSVPSRPPQFEAVCGERLPVLDARLGRRFRQVLPRRGGLGQPGGEAGDEGAATPPGQQRHQGGQKPADRQRAVLGREQFAEPGWGGRCRRLTPALRFPDEGADGEGDEGGQQAAGEDVPPRDFGRGPQPDPGDLVVGEGRQEQPERGRRVQQGARLDPPLFRHDLGHHGGARRPFAPDAQACDDAEPDPARPCSGRGRSRPSPPRTAAWSAKAF